VLVIDRSYSMNDPALGGTTKIAAARTAAKVFLDLLDPGGAHRVALVRFGTSVEPFSPPSTLAPLTAASRTALEATIDTIAATLPIGGSTCYGRALQEAFSVLTAAPGAARRMVVFLTDGKENTAPMASTVYPAMASAGIELHTTSFGTFGADPSGPNAILAEMALASGGSFGQVDDDTLHLQKRFASVARDAMGMITILDPSWVLGRGAGFAQRFPVDLRRGTLLIVVMWGGQARPPGVTITAPWGGAVTARSPGVTRSPGDGHEVVRIELDALARSGREVRGWWSVAGRAPKDVAAGWRVELCVFASDTGPARLVAELRPAAAAADLRVRAFDGASPLAKAVWQVAHVQPAVQTARKLLRRKTSRVRLSRPPRARGLDGVLDGRLERLEPGVHRVRIVVEGTVAVEPEPRPRRGGELRAVPFRREREVSWFVPEPGKAKAKAPRPTPPKPRRSPR
jgi:hypothetical protein